MFDLDSQDVGVSHLCDGLWEQNLEHGLNTLVLWNNQITYQSMTSLSRALVNEKIVCH
jgi:protein phosphatase 1 regulatory subunit 37